MFRPTKKHSSSKIPFIKYSALGNDYLVFDEKKLSLAFSKKHIEKICHRHNGIGSDGMLLVKKESKDCFHLKIYNSDGSRAYKSGNGMRIAAHFIAEHFKVPASFYLKIKQKKYLVQDWKLDQGKFVAKIEMGRIKPLNISSPSSLKKIKLPFYLFDIGNPHLSLIDVDSKMGREEFLLLGEQSQKWEEFKTTRGINLQLVRPASKNKINITIFERGSGHTLASGSSSCASAYACQVHFNSTEDKTTTYKVQNEQGIFTVMIIDKNKIFLAGESLKVFSGQLI